jgi:hypothetical protein
MDKRYRESNWAREPFIAAIKRHPGHRYIPQYNLQWMLFKDQGKNQGMDGESGKPDSYVHKPGSKLAYVEFKQFLWRLVFDDWRDNQRQWRQDNCVAPGCNTGYWIGAHVTWDKDVPRLNNKRASFYLVPAELWLETERMADARGQKGIASVAALGRSSEQDFGLDLLWGEFALIFNGQWEIPVHHPFLSNDYIFRTQNFTQQAVDQPNRVAHE